MGYRPPFARMRNIKAAAAVDKAADAKLAVEAEKEAAAKLPASVDEALAAKGPWGGLVAPRDFNPFAWMLDRPRSQPWQRTIGTEPGSRVLNGGRHSHYFAPIRPGAILEQGP